MNYYFENLYEKKQINNDINDININNTHNINNNNNNNNIHNIIINNNNIHYINSDNIKNVDFKFNHMNSSNNSFKLLKHKNICIPKNNTFDKYVIQNLEHFHNILKILFFWNFELYKNFRKNKIYLNCFQNEIKKDYFYKIVRIYNNMAFENYIKEDNSNMKKYNETNEHTFEEKFSLENSKKICQLSNISEKENESKDKNNEPNQNQKEKNDKNEPTYNTKCDLKIEDKNYININNNVQLKGSNKYNTICTKKKNIYEYDLDSYNNLFLKSENFYIDLLNEYKNVFSKEIRQDDLSLLIKYFVHSFTSNNEEYIISLKDNKFCKNKNRSHKSNHIYIIYNYKKKLFVQKCFDHECAHYISEIYYL
ncbi:hypothetical protein PFDG_02863 [Plasmodium falciparum Dd2]|nr:hypothetical protein PFDG_02863 [Plasmodium falciparum Dd2]